MRKLISAGFARLRKDKAFWICMIFMLGSGIYLPISNYLDGKRADSIGPLDSGFFTHAGFLAILISGFVTLFIGTEHSEGTMRNKIISGHKRSSIYLSDLIICILAGVLICAAHIIPYLAIGIPLMGFFEMDITSVLLIVLCVFLMMTAFISLFLIIAMLCHSKSASSVVCMISTIVILFSGIYIGARLNEPEYYDSYAYTDSDGALIKVEAEKNSFYIDGNKRKVYEFLLDAIPGGQAIQLSGSSAPNPGLMAVSSAVICLAVTSAGLIIFRKKNLK